MNPRNKANRMKWTAVFFKNLLLIKNPFIKTLSGLLIISLVPLLSFADSVDFGGSPESLKGNGDQEPPRCQFEVPRGATEPFFIQWNCVDDVSARDEIRSELWMLRNGALAPQKVSDFLGFPASVQVTAGILGAETFTAGLPASFRLIARDKAGVAAISPFLTVTAQDNSVDSCGLSLNTSVQKIASNSSTALQSASRVEVKDASVNTQQISSSDVRIVTPARVLADPCEIDDVCSDANELTFQTSAEFASDGSATGTITISPGNVVSSLTGTATIENAVLTKLELSGKTTINGVATDVALTCSQ